MHSHEWADDVLFAENCIRLVCEKLTIFPYGQDIVGNVVYWLSGDIVRFKIGVRFRTNVRKCNSYITQNGFTAARRAVITSWHRPVRSLFIDCGPVGLH